MVNNGITKYLTLGNFFRLIEIIFIIFIVTQIILKIDIFGNLTEFNRGMLGGILITYLVFVLLHKILKLKPFSEKQ